METTDRLLSLFEILRDGVVVVDKNSRLLYANESAAKNLGYTKDEFLELTMSDIDAKESKAEMAGRFAGIENGGSLEYQTFQRRKDGTLRTVEVSFHMFAINGEKAAYCLWHDVTPDKKQPENPVNIEQIKASLSKKIKHIEEENSKLEKSLDFTRKEYDTVNTVKQKLEDFINDRNLEFKELNLRLDKEVSKRKELESEIKCVKNLPPPKADETELMGLREKIKLMDVKISSLEEQLREKSHRAAEAGREFNKNLQKIEQLEKQLTAAHKENGNYVKVYSELDASKKLVAFLEGKLAAAEKGAEMAEVMGKELEAAREEIKKTGALENLLAEAKERESRLQEEKNKAHEPYAEKAAAFEEINFKLKERIAGLEDQISDLTAKAEKSKSALSETEKALREAKAGFEKDIQKNNEIRFELDEVKRRLNDVSREKGLEIEALKNELGSETSRLEVELKDAREQVFFKDSRLSEVESQLAQVKRDKEKALQEFNSSKDEADKKIREKDQKIELVNKRLESEYERHEKIEAESFKERGLLENRIKQLTEKIGDLTAELATERSRAEEFKNEMDRQRVQVEEPLRERVMILEETKEKLENEIRQINKAESELLKSRESLENFARERLSELEKANKRLDQELNERKKTIAELLKTREQFKAPIRERMTELEELAGKLEQELANRRAAELELMKSSQHMEGFIKERLGNYMALDEAEKEVPEVTAEEMASGDNIQADESAAQVEANTDQEKDVIPERKDSGLMKFVNIIKGK